jgi:hypothetical protein
MENRKKQYYDISISFNIINPNNTISYLKIWTSFVNYDKKELVLTTPGKIANVLTTFKQKIK